MVRHIPDGLAFCGSGLARMKDRKKRQIRDPGHITRDPETKLVNTTTSFVQTGASFEKSRRNSRSCRVCKCSGHNTSFHGPITFDLPGSGVQTQTSQMISGDNLWLPPTLLEISGANSCSVDLHKLSGNNRIEPGGFTNYPATTRVNPARSRIIRRQHE
jgi:hypothetical protein